MGRLAFGLFLFIQVVEVAEPLVHGFDVGQKLIAVLEVILPKTDRAQNRPISEPRLVSGLAFVSRVKPRNTDRGHAVCGVRMGIRPVMNAARPAVQVG